MKTIEDLKADVRTIRGGGQVEGVTLDGDVLACNGKCYKVMGTERLRLEEVPVRLNLLPEEAPKAPRERASAVDSVDTCSKCGERFVKSKFNPYFTECPTCRRKSRTTGGEARKFTCGECGGEFVVSKFQPYLNPERCPDCNRKAAATRARERARERKAST